LDSFIDGSLYLQMLGSNPNGCSMEAEEFDFLSDPQPWRTVKAEITLCAFIDGPIRNLAKLDKSIGRRGIRKFATHLCQFLTQSISMKVVSFHALSEIF
jgi:hypothetical protein